MSEAPLAGGDVNVGENVVVRVDDTVRRPPSDRAPAVHALLRHFDAVGLPTRDRGGRLRLLCDAYGLDDAGRTGLLDVVADLNRIGYEAHRVLGGVERRPGWREMWDAGSGVEIQARSAWFEGQRDDLLAFLR